MGLCGYFVYTLNAVLFPQFSGWSWLLDILA